MSKRSKQTSKLGRKPNVPQQKSQQPQTTTSYGSFVPFLQVGNKRITPLKPDAKLLRNWSRANPIVRRCVNIIKDKLVRQPYEFTNKNPADTTDYTNVINILNQMLERPNNVDDRREFFSSIDEDLVVGDCGCFEIAPTGNSLRPIFLFSTDGFSISKVLNDNTYAYAQRVLDSVTSVSSDYVYFKPNEMIYMQKQVTTNNPYGLSPIECAFEYIKALTQTFTYSSDIASNALPKYLANIKGIQGNQLDAYRAYFMQECMGVPVLPMVSAEDVQSVQIAPISEEATFMQYQQFVIAIIALAFGIPPEKLAIAKSNDRSTIAEINENLLQDAIQPYADVKESAMNKLLSILGLSDRIVFRYIWADTLDQKQQKQNMALDAYQKDAITRNELRKALGYPESDDEFANDFITVYKARVNEKYGINGFGASKQNNNGSNQKGGGDKVE